MKDQQKTEQYSGARDQEIRAALDQHWAASDVNDFETEHLIYHEDAVLDYPQSGKRTRGRYNIQNQRATQPSKSGSLSDESFAAVTFGSLNSSCHRKRLPIDRRQNEGSYALDVSALRGSFTLHPGANPVVLVSAGVGATPVISMLHTPVF